MSTFDPRCRDVPSLVSRRRFLTMAAGVSTVPFLAGCGQSEPVSGEIELTFLNQSRGQVPALEKLTATYAERTGVKVVVDTPGPTDFPAKLQSKAQSRDMPDIYSSIGLDEMAPYYKAGWALDLRSELDSGWGENFTPAAVQFATFADGNPQGVEPGIYSAHWELAAFGLLRNTASYHAAGIDTAAAPADSGEWLDQLKRIGNTGKAPFSVAASMTWALVQSYASNWLSDEEIAATFAGRSTWRSDAWNKAFQLLVQMRDAGVLANNAIPGGSGDNPQVEKSFFNIQDTATIFDGSYGVAVGMATASDFTEFTSAGLPRAPDGTADPRPAGGVGKGASINPRGEHADEALKFVKWLTEPDQAKVFLETIKIVPANPKVLTAGGLPAQVEGFASLMDNIQLVIAPAKNVQDAIGRAAQSLILKERTVDQVLDDIASVQS